jgi:hypothetical protein
VNEAQHTYHLKQLLNLPAMWISKLADVKLDTRQYATEPDRKFAARFSSSNAAFLAAKSMLEMFRSPSDTELHNSLIPFEVLGARSSN